MYGSLKTWLNLPVIIKPCSGRTGTGTKTFIESISTVCYAEGKVEVVTNSIGKEIVSMKRLYMDGNSSISELDNVIFEGKEVEVQAIGYFYRNGVVDIKVVYL